jgi:superfamily II DNA helicase RecQ
VSSFWFLVEHEHELNDMLFSSLTAEQARSVKDGVLSGDLKMLYVAPEKYDVFLFRWIRALICFRLNNEGFVQLMSQVEYAISSPTQPLLFYLRLGLSINLLAIDESHCISQVSLHTLLGRFHQT